ncbi:MAG TPA: TetR family transcriptional regulator [Candidatus Eremiobacteraceae bacterium]
MKVRSRARLGITPAREEAEQAFLDAAERLLVSVGYADITTRKLAEEAGLNHGLVHYYFGSMPELLLQVLERHTDRLIKRQREMYAEDKPFIEKWRNAMGYLDEDSADGYAKVWFELQAMSWNDAEMRKRVAKVDLAWFQVVTEAFDKAFDEYGLDRNAYPLEAIVTLVSTFNLGMHLRMLSGIRTGHAALLKAIDDWLQKLESQKRTKRKP